MTYVYLLSRYHEYGAENVAATLDRSKLPQILVDHFGGDHIEVETLQALLARDDQDIADEGGINLSDGWGGIQLHVVLLDAPATVIT